MTTFCGNCGAPVDGSFCRNCGARAAQQPAAAAAQPLPVTQPGAVPVASSGTSGLKIVLIIVGVLFFFGVLAIGGLYLAGRSLIRHAETASGVVTVPEPSRSGGIFSSLRGSLSPHRDVCALLPASEVASILDVEVGRTEGRSEDGQRQDQCDYYLKPGTSDAYAEKLKESIRAAEANGNQSADVNSVRQLNEQTRKSGAESMIKNMLRAGNAVANDGSQPFFSVVVEREGGRKTFGVMERTNSAGRVLLNGVEMAEKVSGVGDRAMMTPLDSALIVLKGDTCVTLNLTQVPNGREKGVELAKRVVSRL